MEAEYQSFLTNLLRAGNRIRSERGLQNSNDASDAIVFVSSDILTNSIPLDDLFKAGESPVHSRNAGAFTCLIVSSILTWIKKEHIVLPANHVLAATFLSLYQMHERDTIGQLAADGARYYRSITESAIKEGNISNLIRSLNGTVWAYVMTSNDLLIEKFSDLYEQIKVPESTDYV